MKQGDFFMENVIIIGAGPAGISAALYAARANLNPLVIENGAGALIKADKIENYYGLEAPISGEELYERGIAQAKALDVRIMTAQVLGISGYGSFSVQTAAGNFDAKTVILATGSRHKTPEIPGIRELEGKGVSYCAICDAFFYRGKEVAVLGNGDFALHEAETLSHVASGVTIYTDGKEPEFSRTHSIPVNTLRIQSIKGKNFVEGLMLEPEEPSDDKPSKGKKKKAEPVLAPADGVFVALGTAGSTEIARQMGAELTEKGNIRINENMESTIPGLYAAGDCTGGLLQVAKAVYEGAQAALSAGKYIRQKGK